MNFDPNEISDPLGCPRKDSANALSRAPRVNKSLIWNSQTKTKHDTENKGSRICIKEDRSKGGGRARKKGMERMKKQERRKKITEKTEDEVRNEEGQEDKKEEGT